MAKIRKDFLEGLEEIDMGQPTDDDKYVIFKREDWDHMLAGLGGPPGHPIRVLMDKCIPDGTVIRRQDVYAPPALEMYAKGIEISLAVAALDEAGQPTERTKRLRRTADHFHGQAELAYQEHADGRAKLPD